MTKKYQTMITQHPKYEIRYEELDPMQLTFQGGISLPIHSWVRLTPSFSPILVSNLLEEFDCDSGSTVLDPFDGVGTTTLQCQLQGIDSIGVELNPFLHYVALAKTRWNKELTILRTAIHGYLNKLQQRSHAARNIPLRLFPQKLNIELPKLYNYSRWWKDDVLKDLLIARQTISSTDSKQEHQEFFKLGLASILMDVANVTYEGVQFTFIDRSRESINTLRTLRARLQKMYEDLRVVQSGIKRPGRVDVILGDSTEMHELLKGSKATCVITSPPYPNRYSYVWNTRPYLYFFSFFSKASEASDLDEKSIGGTWGKATSDLQKGHVQAENSTIEAIVGSCVDEIRQDNSLTNTNLMANYVMRYFNKIHKHVRSLSRVLAGNARLAYVVGNSEIKGVEIPTDIFLADIFESQNIMIDRIARVRKRHSGKRLYESIVYATAS